MINEANYTTLVDEKHTDVQKLHNELDSHYGYSNWKNPTYKDDQIGALQRYKGDSTSVNGNLWNRHQANNPHLRQHPDIEHLDSALNEKKTPREIKVWSGTRHDPRKIMNSEGIVHHPAYLSTSINPKVGAQFSRNGSTDEKPLLLDRHILHIRVPKDHPGAYLGKDFEKEFLLPRAMNLKYKKTSVIKATNTGFGNVANFHIHHMELV